MTSAGAKKKGRVGSQERLAFIESEQEMTTGIKEGIDDGLEYPANLLWRLEKLGCVSPIHLVVSKDPDYGGKGWALAPWTQPAIVFELYNATFETFDPPNITEHIDEMYEIEYERRQEVKRAAEEKRHQVAERKSLREQAEKRYKKFGATKLGRQTLNDEEE